MNNNKGYTSVSEKDIELADQTNNVIQVERGNSNIQVIKKKSDIDFVKKNSNTDLLSHEVEIHVEFNAEFEAFERGDKCISLDLLKMALAVPRH